MKIYTKTGDKGKTSLLSGERVLKSDLRLDAYGTVDELSSFVGLLGSYDISESHKKFLYEIQNKLYNAGTLLAVRTEVKFDLPKITEADIELIEKETDMLSAKLPPLKSFVLPGGDTVVAQAHVCRSICRRAERAAVKLSETEPVNESVIVFLNRLSDYFFVLSRSIAYEKGVSELLWKP
ncbi:MAG: cob(I)yrinic acid a,c-diamide adenosyltransferase [Chlorobi bacterium]|nr:cob(I)yrinic acid a,c-diamide adenosyltransferase [Chlorobiota bacterium]